MSGKRLVKLFSWLMLVAFSTSTFAMPNIRTEYGYSLQGMARVKVINETNRVLACYVGLDGRKIKFKLPNYAHSLWYKATDKRFHYSSFTVWCDYIEYHPEYNRL